MQWILNIFYITTAVFVIFAGKMADGFGHKKIFILGLILYALGAISLALVHFHGPILFFRAMQGIGAAFVMPSAMAIMMTEFLPSQLGKALGFSAGISSIFLSIGPFLGGVLTEVFCWRWVFLFPLVLCVASMLLAYFFVPKRGRTDIQLDFKGLLLLMVGLGTLMFGLMQVKYWGWFSAKFINYHIFYHFNGVILPLQIN
jgi:MFS family permease